MKLALLATAAALAFPMAASAQMDPQTSPPPTTTTSTSTMSPVGSTPSTMPGATPMGGYQPTAPAMSGPMTADTVVRYQQAPEPSVAYPAPAPLASYPVCKKGQYDKCRNPGGR